MYLWSQLHGHSKPHPIIGRNHHAGNASILLVLACPLPILRFQTLSTQSFLLVQIDYRSPSRLGPVYLLHGEHEGKRWLCVRLQDYQQQGLVHHVRH